MMRCGVGVVYLHSHVKSWSTQDVPYSRVRIRLVTRIVDVVYRGPIDVSMCLNESGC